MNHFPSLKMAKVMLCSVMSVIAKSGDVAGAEVLGVFFLNDHGILRMYISFIIIPYVCFWLASK